MLIFTRFFMPLLFTLMLTGCTHFGQYSSHPYHETDESQAAQEAGPAYRKADRTPKYYARLKKSCLAVNGHEVCGYDCKRAGDRVVCAEQPDQRCVTDSTGQIACGYDCKSTYAKVACGKYLYDNCVTNALGEIRCGNNCYEREDGELVCGK